MQKTTEKKHTSRGRVAVFGTLKVMVAASLLVAMSIVCGKYLAVGVGNVLRFSFENLPILLAGFLFGPVVGAVTGIAADLIGCFLVGYAVNPLVTLGAATVGLVGGTAYTLLKVHTRLPHGVSVAVSTALAHLCGSVVVKTLGLSAFYDMPLGVLMLWRLLNYAIVGVLEFLLLCFITKNKAVTAMFGGTRWKQ